MFIKYHLHESQDYFGAHEKLLLSTPNTYSSAVHFVQNVNILTTVL